MVSSGSKAFGTPGELQQSAARVVGAALRVRTGTQVQDDHIVGVVLIEDRAAAHCVNVLVVSLVHGSAAAQRRGGGSGTRRHTAQERECRPVADAPPARAAIAFRDKLPR